MPSAVLDHAFQALADPTRRAVVAQLSKGPASVSELAASHVMALPSFVQHLRILEDCGLITSRKQGRVRTCQIKPQALSAVEQWVGEQRRKWEQRLDQFDAFVNALNKNKSGD